MTQAGKILELRLLMLFRLIEKEFSNKRWEFLQEALSVGERINNPGRSNNENCQKITQTGEIFCKRPDTEGVTGVEVMVKGDWDSLVCFGGTSLRISVYREYGNEYPMKLHWPILLRGLGVGISIRKKMKQKYKSRKKELGIGNRTKWKTSVKWVLLLLNL